MPGLLAASALSLALIHERRGTEVLRSSPICFIADSSSPFRVHTGPRFYGSPLRGPFLRLIILSGVTTPQNGLLAL